MKTSYGPLYTRWTIIFAILSRVILWLRGVNYYIVYDDDQPHRERENLLVIVKSRNEEEIYKDLISVATINNFKRPQFSRINGSIMVLKSYSTGNVFYALPEKIDDPHDGLGKMFRISTEKTSEVTYVYTVKILWWCITTVLALSTSIVSLVNIFKG